VLREAVEEGRLSIAELAHQTSQELCDELRSLAQLLVDNAPDAAVDCRWLLGKVWVEQVLQPGKVRGFARLRIQICDERILY
jgi:hypothetical protein